MQSDTVNDLILFADHCDLYLMVQYFCLVISDLILYKDIFEIPLQSDAMNNFIQFVGDCDIFLTVNHLFTACKLKVRVTLEG